MQKQGETSAAPVRSGVDGDGFGMTREGNGRASNCVQTIRDCNRLVSRLASSLETRLSG